VASVDGEPVTLSDLKQFVAAQGGVTPEAIAKGEFEAEKYLHDLIVQQLLEKEAKSSGVTVGDAEIDAYIDEIRKQNHADAGEFEQLLKHRGLSPADYRRQVAADILKTRVIGARVRSRVNVSDQDIERYVRDNPRLMPQEGELHVQQIFIGADRKDAMLLDPKQEMERMHGELEDGKEMPEVGGQFYVDLGYVNADDLLPELQSAVAGLDAGEATPVIESEKGLYILRVADKREGNKLTLSEELKQTLRRELFDGKLREEMTKYLSDELPKKYNVEIKL
jgi:parvulin-like peptidyl-prolyl isomerase